MKVKMENPYLSFYIARLILKSLQGTLTEKEKHELKEWLSADPRHLESYTRWQQNELSEKKRLLVQLHPEKSWKQIENRIRFHRPPAYLRLLKYAAIAILSCGLGLLSYHQYRSTDLSSSLFSNAYPPVPGSAKATLILESGEQMELVNGQNFYLRSDSCIRLNNMDNTLKVEISDSLTEQIETYSTLSVPKGGEYRILLSDGSKIWLNADSRLRFPSYFHGNQRKVYLKGEAYFEVARNTRKPFIVAINNLEVEVLGTKFGVKAYPEDEIVYTTLLSGCVKTSAPATRQSLILYPDEQSLFHISDQKIEKRKVDAHTFLGWTEGRFVFENETLKEIMKQLGRWYNMEVSYQTPELEQYRFTGNTDRFEDISTLLGMIEKTYRISFTMNGKHIVVKKR